MFIVLFGFLLASRARMFTSYLKENQEGTHSAFKGKKKVLKSGLGLGLVLGLWLGLGFGLG
jgi:hypothetical protein